MKRVLLLLSAMGLAFTMQGCAIYATPYGYSPGYYEYAPYYGFSFNYWPHSYYSYRSYYHGFRPGNPGWGGRPWSGGHNWGGRGRWGGGGHWGGGHGGWRGR